MTEPEKEVRPIQAVEPVPIVHNASDRAVREFELIATPSEPSLDFGGFPRAKTPPPIAVAVFSLLDA